MTPFGQRSVSTLAVACLVLPGALLAGCGSGGGASSSAPMASAPPIDASRGGYRQSAPPMRQAPPQQKQGMSTGKKVAILAGAAALYYMYKKNKEKRAANPQSAPQYYLSKNGRVYYRESNGQAVYVTPPRGGIEVPYAESQEYSGYQGYNNSNSGRTLQDLVNSGGYAADPRGDYNGRGGAPMGGRRY